MWHGRLDWVLLESCTGEEGARVSSGFLVAVVGFEHCREFFEEVCVLAKCAVGLEVGDWVGVLYWRFLVW